MATAARASTGASSPSPPVVPPSPPGRCTEWVASKIDGQAFLAHPVERAHVGDQVVVAEGGAALGDEEAFAAEGAHLAGDVDGIPRGEELAFFHVHRAAGLGGGFEQVGLAAEKGRDLQQVDVFGGDVGLFGGVDVGGDGDLEFLGDFTEDAATFLGCRGRGRTRRRCGWPCRTRP